MARPVPLSIASRWCFVARDDLRIETSGGVERGKGKEGAGRDIELVAADGFRLAATLYMPTRPNGMAVQVNSASSTPRRYYALFAAFLATRGFVVLTYDYRGVGRPVRGNPASLLAWGGLDQPAATAFLRTHFADRALAVVAHSMGGQLLGLSRHAGDIRAALLVCSGQGWWRAWPDARGRFRRWWVWRVVAPLAVPLFGYLPGWVRGRGANTAAGIARDTMRFSRSPHFFCTEDGRPLRPFNGDIRVPVRLVTFSDDQIVPPGAELSFPSYYPNAISRTDRLTPEQLGMVAIDHFGFFQKNMQRNAWADAADWLSAHAT